MKNVNTMIIGLLFKELDKIDILHDQENNFNNRLTAQKIIYLFNNKVLELLYGFSYYERGPYSPTLQIDLLDIEKNYEEFIEWISTDSFTKEKLEEINAFNAFIKEIENIDMEYGFEMAAKLWYIKDGPYFLSKDEKTKDDLVKYVKGTHIMFERKNVSEIYDILEKVWN